MWRSTHHPKRDQHEPSPLPPRHTRRLWREPASAHHHCLAMTRIAQRAREREGGRARRHTTRRTPFDRCPAWRCDGTIEFLREDQDNYNLQLLDERYTMLRPEEHTAMVPHEERERLENLFKGDSDAPLCAHRRSNLV